MFLSQLMKGWRLIQVSQTIHTLIMNNAYGCITDIHVCSGACGDGYGTLPDIVQQEHTQYPHC